MSQPVLDLPIHDPQLLLRVGPNDLVAGDPAGMPGRRVDLEVAGQAAPERKLLGLAPGQVVQRSSRRPLRKRFRWWGCQDLNLGLHPYQRSAPGRVSPGSFLRPGRMMHRWRPLRTARLRWDVDQTWTRHAPHAGAAALRVADLAWQGRPPPAAPDKRAPPGNRLARGSPGGVWARDIPLYRRAVPGHRHGGSPAPCSFKPHARR
jgi:hypothetical protein